MNKTTKVILMSVLTIVACVSLISGATFALFTSESSVNIAVTSGKVDVQASVQNLKTYSYQLSSSGSYESTEQTSGNFIYGTAVLSDDAATLTLSNLVPGDKATFTVSVQNLSTVATQYRAIVSCLQDTGLFAGLKVTIGGTEFAGYSAHTDWTALQAETAPDLVEVSVELPYGADNEYMEKSCTITYKVEAVQGNAKVENISDGSTGIFTASDLVFAASQVNSGSAADAVFELGNDIDLSDVDWQSVGTETQSFTGALDGKGHTIKGVNKPLFQRVAGASVSNLNVVLTDSGTLCYSSYANGGELTSFNKVVVSGETSNIGFVEYITQNTSFTDCVNEATVTTEQNGAGFITYAHYGKITFTNCVNKGNITSSRSTGAKATGFIAVTYNGTDIVLNNCRNEGDMTVIGSAEMYAGGFVGYHVGTKLELTDCVNAGAITATRLGGGGSTVSAGGIIAAAWSNSAATLNNVENHGAISADNQADGHNAYVGGIVGMCNPGSDVTINGAQSDATLTGKISNSANAGGQVRVGGIVGHTNSVNNVTVQGVIVCTENMKIITEQANGKDAITDAIVGSESGTVTVIVTQLTNNSQQTTRYAV